MSPSNGHIAVKYVIRHSGKRAVRIDISDCIVRSALMYVVCNRAYSDKISLINHIWKHSGERHYVCDVCNKAKSQRVV